MSAPLVDSHCHLDTDAFAADRDDVLARARAAGLCALVAVGAGRGEAGPSGAIELARRNPGWIFATAGLHPHDARLLSLPHLEEIARAANDPVVVAIGETGLDFHYDLSPRDVQRDAFRRQIALARAVKKPIVVHTRDAPDDTLAILREEKARDVGGIVHCFSENAAFARAALELGFVASFSGLCTFLKAAAVLDAAMRQSLDAILVETDAPFLAPVPERGKRNEPAFLVHTADFIARARGIDPDEFRGITVENARRLLRLGS